MLRKNDYRDGFTLVEILVAVAILAILSATLSPLVLKYINDGRRARALSDSQTLGQGILQFQVDAGMWPVSNDGNVNDAGELSRLVGLPSGDISAANIPGGAGTAPGDGNWDGGGNGGRAGAIEDHLIYNADDDTDPLYPVSASPPEPPGWNGPYLKSVPQDPWGNPYVCNVRYLQNANVGGVTQAEVLQHAVFCLSAGPNGLYETSFADATELENQPGGDDIGWLIQGNQNR
jgi:prepilin-type N-terminal cleavage/methylation domain-containing protein